MSDIRGEEDLEHEDGDDQNTTRTMIVAGLREDFFKMIFLRNVRYSRKNRMILRTIEPHEQNLVRKHPMRIQTTRHRRKTKTYSKFIRRP